jgi:hypothetical protein
LPVGEDGEAEDEENKEEEEVPIPALLTQAVEELNELQRKKDAEPDGD